MSLDNIIYLIYDGECPFVNYAAKVMLGHNKVTDFKFNPKKKGYAIKEPVF